MTVDFYEWERIAIRRYEDATGMHLIIHNYQEEGEWKYIIEVIGGAGVYDEVLGTFDTEDEVRLYVNALIKQARLDKMMRG